MSPLRRDNLHYNVAVSPVAKLVYDDGFAMPPTTSPQDVHGKSSGLDGIRQRCADRLQRQLQNPNVRAEKVVEVERLTKPPPSPASAGRPVACMRQFTSPGDAAGIRQFASPGDIAGGHTEPLATPPQKTPPHLVSTPGSNRCTTPSMQTTARGTSAGRSKSGSRGGWQSVRSPQDYVAADRVSSLSRGEGSGCISGQGRSTATVRSSSRHSARGDSSSARMASARQPSSSGMARPASASRLSRTTSRPRGGQTPTDYWRELSLARGTATPHWKAVPPSGRQPSRERDSSASVGARASSTSNTHSWSAGLVTPNVRKVHTQGGISPHCSMQRSSSQKGTNPMPQNGASFQGYGHGSDARSTCVTPRSLLSVGTPSDSGPYRKTVLAYEDTESLSLNVETPLDSGPSRKAMLAFEEVDAGSNFMSPASQTAWCWPYLPAKLGAEVHSLDQADRFLEERPAATEHFSIGDRSAHGERFIPAEQVHQFSEVARSLETAASALRQAIGPETISSDIEATAALLKRGQSVRDAIALGGSVSSNSPSGMVLSEDRSSTAQFRLFGGSLPSNAPSGMALSGDLTAASPCRRLAVDDPFSRGTYAYASPPPGVTQMEGSAGRSLVHRHDDAPVELLTRENEALRGALGDAVRRLTELEGEKERFMSEDVFDLVNTLCRKATAEGEPENESQEH